MGMSDILKALSLANAMILGGEEHTNTSLMMFEKARESCEARDARIAYGLDGHK